jgi:hypothetical protein
VTELCQLLEWDSLSAAELIHEQQQSVAVSMHFQLQHLQLRQVLVVLLKIHTSDSSDIWADPDFSSSVASVAAAVNNIHRATVETVSDATSSSRMQQPELAQAAAACNSLSLELLSDVGSALQELSLLLKAAHCKPQTSAVQQQQQQQQLRRQQAQR